MSARPAAPNGRPTASGGPAASGPRVWLVVCGERERGDDGAGPAAVDGLPLDLVARCELRMASGLEVETIVDIPPGAACVLVDAALGIAPGQVVIRSLDSIVPEATAGSRGPGAVVERGPAPRSSHSLPVDQTLALARIVRGALPDGVFVGIGASGATLGAPLSAPVEAGMATFRAAIEGELIRFLDEVEAPPSPGG